MEKLQYRTWALLYGHSPDDVKDGLPSVGFGKILARHLDENFRKLLAIGSLPTAQVPMKKWYAEHDTAYLDDHTVFTAFNVKRGMKHLQATLDFYDGSIYRTSGHVFSLRLLGLNSENATPKQFERLTSLVYSHLTYGINNNQRKQFIFGVPIHVDNLADYNKRDLTSQVMKSHDKHMASLDMRL